MFITRSVKLLIGVATVGLVVSFTMVGALAPAALAGPALDQPYGRGDATSSGSSVWAFVLVAAVATVVAVLATLTVLHTSDRNRSSVRRTASLASD